MRVIKWYISLHTNSSVIQMQCLTEPQIILADMPYKNSDHLMLWLCIHEMHFYIKAIIQRYYTKYYTLKKTPKYCKIINAYVTSKFKWEIEKNEFN